MPATMWPKLWIFLAFLGIQECRGQFTPILNNLAGQIPGVLDQVSQTAANLVANDLIAQENVNMLAAAQANQFFGRPAGPVVQLGMFDTNVQAPIPGAPLSPSFSPTPSFGSPALPSLVPPPASAAISSINLFPSSAPSPSPSRVLPPLQSPERLDTLHALTNARTRQTDAILDRGSATPSTSSRVLPPLQTPESLARSHSLINTISRQTDAILDREGAAVPSSSSAILPPLQTPQQLNTIHALNNARAQQTAVILDSVNGETIRAVSAAAAAKGLQSVARQLSDKQDFNNAIPGSKLQGRCLDDGLYYHDTNSYLVCVHGTAHIQPCPPGTRTFPEVRLQTGRPFTYSDFCSMNMVDHGYNVAAARQNVDYHSRKYAKRPATPPTPSSSDGYDALPYDYTNDHGLSYSAASDSSVYKTISKVGPNGAVYYYHYYEK